MKPVRQLCCPKHDYWKHQYAIVIMSHTKAGYPIIRALLDMGMYVVAVAHKLEQNEMLRHCLTKQQERHYFTKQVDLHRIMSINMLILELELEVNQVKLFLCLLPQINDKERCEIFEKANLGLLQTILEVDDMSVSALCAIASRHIIEPNYSHMWCIRFHHQEHKIVHDYMEYLLTLADKAPYYLNVNLIGNQNRGSCEC